MTVRYQEWTNLPTQLATNGKVNSETKTLTRRRTVSGNKPQWRQLIANGADATTALNGEFVRAWVSPGRIQAKWLQDKPTNLRCTESVDGDFAGYAYSIPPGSSDSALMAEADRKASIRLNKKLRGFDTKLQGGVVVGELRETLRMLRRPAAAFRDGLGKYLDALVKRKRFKGKKSDPERKARDHARDVQNLSKTAADTWLEYVFGWSPFINDIKDAMEAYKSLSRKHETIRVGAGAHADKVLSQATSSGAYKNYCFYTESNLYTARAHVRYTGAFNIRADTNTLAETYDRFGFTLKQFVPTAWELLPWSFLADYFSNIGDVLEYDHAVYQQLAWLCRGQLYEERKARYIAPDFTKSFSVNGEKVQLEGNSSYAIYERRNVSRGSVSAAMNINMTDIRFELPDYWKQFANMGALLVSANAIHPQKFRR